MLRKMEVLLRFSGLKVLRCNDENVRRGQIDKRYKIAWTWIQAKTRQWISELGQLFPQNAV